MEKSLMPIPIFQVVKYNSTVESFVCFLDKHKNDVINDRTLDLYNKLLHLIDERISNCELYKNDNKFIDMDINTKQNDIKGTPRKSRNKSKPEKFSNIDDIENHNTNNTKSTVTTVCRVFPKIVDPHFKITKKVSFILENYSNQIKRAKIDASKSMSKNTYLDKDLLNIYRERYPNVNVYYFGSRLHGLLSKKSDVDIFVDLDNNYNETPKKADLYSKISDAEKILLNNQNKWKVRKFIGKARTPIINVYHSKSKLLCDLSFSNGLAHCNSKLIKYIFDLQPQCYNVCLFMKKIIKELCINMNTYTLINLVIFYFQVHKYLPSIQQLQLDIEPNIIDGWQGNFKEYTLDQLNIQKCKVEPLDHIIELFQYYGQFEYTHNVICPLLGVPINRKCFETSNLPLEMHRLSSYMLNKTANPDKYNQDIFDYTTPICVQDPLELIHNISKMIKSYALESFVLHCKYSVEYIEKIINNN